MDTLGAGDTFIARVLVGLLEGEAPQSLLQAAADAAAHTCTYLGAVGYGVPIDVAKAPNNSI
ncbi:PfkB family carbohydrate kinase [Mesorhizobium sp. WSM2239]|uniref:PfkB family carbohydrate kinase n=2 Tax=unclassified Mesorhizobium TaxID=325217 RepID=A0AAU8DHY6_9HYPH